MIIKQLVDFVTTEAEYFLTFNNEVGLRSNRSLSSFFTLDKNPFILPIPLSVFLSRNFKICIVHQQQQRCTCSSEVLRSSQEGAQGLQKWTLARNNIALGTYPGSIDEQSLFSVRK